MAFRTSKLFARGQNGVDYTILVIHRTKFMFDEEKYNFSGLGNKRDTHLSPECCVTK